LRNRQLIYQYIRKKGSVSRQDIVVALKMSLPTVTNNLNYLEQMGLVDTSRKIQTIGGGRNATAYTYIQNPKFAIGAYLTEHHISVVSVDFSGRVVNQLKEHILFEPDNVLYLQKLGEMVEKVKVMSKILDEDLLGVGIAVPGLVSEDGEEVTYGKTFNVSGRDFTGKTRTEIAAYIPYPSRLCHDAYTAGFAELWSNPELHNAFYLSLVNSIGGCVIVNNEIYEGDTHKGGLVEHMVLVPQNGETCYCGKKGCFDTLCRAGILDAYTDGSLEDFFRLLKEGDAGAAKLWDVYLDNLALGISNIRVMLDCTIVLGGYVGSFISDYLDELCKRIDERFPFDDKAETYVKQCSCVTEASASGAALQYIRNFIENI